MRRLLIVPLLIAGLGFTQLYASESSPWGVEVYRNYPVIDSTEYYKREFDLAKNAGFGWIRSVFQFLCEQGYPSNHWWDFTVQDSAVKWMDERGLNILFLSYPTPWRTTDTAWATYWKMQVERYDGDGVGCGGYVDFVDSLHIKPVKYWELFNEPNGWQSTHAFWRPDAPSPYILSKPLSSICSYYETINGIRHYICNYTTCDTIFCDSLLLDNISHLRRYIRVSDSVIKECDPTAKVVTPTLFAITSPNPAWSMYVKDTVTKPNITGYLEICYKPVEFYWSQILDSVGDNIDVISSNRYEDYPSDRRAAIDSLDSIFQRHSAGDKPFFIPETGWDLKKFDEITIGTYYKQLFEGLLKEEDWRTGKNKLFCFLLADWLGTKEYGIWGLCDSSLTCRPSFDSIQHFIFFNSDDSTFSGHNNQHLLQIDASGNLHMVNSSWGDIHYAMSSNGGTSWSKFMVIGEGKSPAISINGAGNMTIVWIGEDGKLYYKCKTGSGWGDNYELYDLCVQGL